MQEDDNNLVLLADISLLVEHPLSKREVVGSNPTGGSMAIATDHAIAAWLPVADSFVVGRHRPKPK